MKYFVNIFYVILLLNFSSYAQDTAFVRTYGQNGYNYGEKIIQTPNNAYIILGNKSGFTGNTDVYLLKTNKSGNLIWDKAYGGSETNWAEDIITTPDGGYAITGYISIPSNNNDYNIMLLKTDSSGNLQWMKNFGGNGWDMAHSIISTADSGFIITGETFSYGNGNNDIFILKTNKNGDSVWTKIYGNTKDDIAYDINKCYDGNFLITGISNNFANNNYDPCIYKINPAGDTLWTKNYHYFFNSNNDSLDNKAFVGIKTSDNSIVVSGSKKNTGTNSLDIFLLKLDSVGNPIWMRTFGGNKDEESCDVIQNSNGGFFIASYSKTYTIGAKDFYSIITDNGGWFVNGHVYGGKKNDIPKACIQTSDKGYAIIGTTESKGTGITNIVFVKTDSMGVTDTLIYSHIAGIDENVIQNILLYPNPVTDILYIKSYDEMPVQYITIYNHIGQEIKRSKPFDMNSINIYFSSFPNGIYFISLHFDDTVINRKIIHIR